ncbi:MAG: protein kinase [Gemmatimonadales bacterium]
MAAAVHETLAQSLTGLYDLEREIGHGGMATVYLARDIRHERQVAIKVLLPALTATVGVERFLREIRVVARLQHPHILPLFDSGEAAGLLYFVMPFVDGESLRARLDREQVITLSDTMRIIRQVADALDYAHARGVVHRDVKPENVLLAGSQAFLADFGVARAAFPETGDAGTLTSLGMTLGTPAYMSPEQAAAELDIDGRSDVYSLGCVCYEMLAGNPPFRGMTPMALMSKHIASPVPPLTGIRELIPQAVCEAVHKALAKEPGGRLAAAGDLATAIESGVVDARLPSAIDLRLMAVEQEQRSHERVLVIEFTNLTRAADAEWLSTGIAETVSADLNRVDGIKVVGQDAGTRKRIDAMRNAGPIGRDEAVSLARSIGADWATWGAFQKLGERIRITAHYADIETGDTVHEEKLDGTMEDIFSLQDRIVTRFTDLAGVYLNTGETARIRAGSRDLTAYEHYARGYQAYHRFGKESAKAAVEHFRAAIRIDPNYAQAHSGLGLIHAPLYIATGNRVVLEEGMAALERALELDPSLGDAYAWLAYMQFRGGRFDDAVKTAVRGIERDPGSFMCWYMLGCSHLSWGVAICRPDELARVVAPMLRSITLNPTFHPAHIALGSVYILRGAHAHATPLIDRAVGIELSGAGHQFIGALVQRAFLHIASGELDLAAPLLNVAIERYTGADHVYAETMCAYAHWARGLVGERLGALDKAEADFRRACEIADAHEGRINIGGHWVKARCGLARVQHRLGLAAEADRSLGEARELFRSRQRFVWTWFVGGTDADMLFEISSTLATMGNNEEALYILGDAADAGWADVTSMRHDPAFADLRDTEAMQKVCLDAASRVIMPPPTGSGGIS